MAMLPPDTSTPSMARDDQAVIASITKIVQCLFPQFKEEAVSKDITAMVMGTGYGEYHQVVADYIRTNLNAPEGEPLALTFQELTEVLGLLPPRAPKELEVNMYRDPDGGLKMQFIGEIDVARTAGRNKE